MVSISMWAYLEILILAKICMTSWFMHNLTFRYIWHDVNLITYIPIRFTTLLLLTYQINKKALLSHSSEFFGPDTFPWVSL